ncbi:uncharacterized protein BJ212DRAFT_1305774 [Suillus subaureus]|uniref:Uncharacterized protein n=1 Tax=Suillus subaureus TaxID=48587 RepID=A0A9P7IZN2_9AGAM|nr:uncharacterized protein BJ212DRAFT_1305774 [Suillus subaureus]KAG1798304.1 hypothetical protein BJ212DRAFT_1305774 [Suillus subaureus]
MTLPGKVIRINENATIRLMPTNHLPPRLKRLLQRQQDSNISERSDSALPPVEEPASSAAISQAEPNIPAITQSPSHRKRKTRRSREKENNIASPIALKRRHRIRARLDHGTASTTHTTID